MLIDRRNALGLLGAGAAAGHAKAEPVSSAVFQHGVAAGDPLSDRLVLWTRVSGVQGDTPVTLEVAETAAFQRPRRIRLTASAARDHTLKHDVAGLKPGREYFYRFRAGGAVSPVGRARTLPRAAKDVVLAVASCSLHPNGYFNAYRAMADLDRLDAVVHLGDYIYEYGAGPEDYGMANGQKLGRTPQPPHEIVSLADYRARHAQYKSDPDLQAAHARAAWIVVWDDHESANDAFVDGAQNHQPEDGDWAARKAAALQAYYEWMPIREAAGQPLREAVNRSFRFGRIASLHMLETRLLARSKQLNYERDLTLVAGPGGAQVPDIAGFKARLQAPDRRLLGEGQLAWLEADLRASVEAGAAWQLIGNQIVMGRVNGPDLDQAFGREQVQAALETVPAAIRAGTERLRALFTQGLPLNLDSWDGYPAERERLYGVLRRTGARPIVLAGDSHIFWANELADGSGARVAVEFGATSVTSPPPGLDSRIPGVKLTPVVTAQNPEVVFCDESRRGFVLLTLTDMEAKAEFVAVSTIAARAFQAEILKTFTVRKDGPGLGPIVAA